MHDHQVSTVVVTGGSAGVGRATALVFARRGWNVAIIARDEAGLEHAREEIAQAGGQVLTISADVADANAISAAADQVVQRWERIDVWVNNAMATMFAPVGEISPAEFRRITEVTYLGYVHGTMAALKHMRRHNTGIIVQVGSALAYRAIPLQAGYCGAKFAIRGFTDSVRTELRHERSAIRLTMVQLPAVNTPQFDWARNKLPNRPQPLPPIYQPEGIAEAICRASQRAPRELWVGWPSVKAILGTMLLPGMLDGLLASRAYAGQLAPEPRQPDQEDNLFEPVPMLHAAHGRFDAQARRTAPIFNPAVLRAAIAAAAIALVATMTAVLIKVLA
jgi:NAD(P)-dependent dehydrogenase (short-subunit alcohol dehydrogenase family)